MKIETCGSCNEEKIIKFECGFCIESRMCRDCGYEHRVWCEARDDWDFIN